MFVRMIEVTLILIRIIQFSLTSYAISTPYSLGRFIKDKSLCTELVMPDFTNCTLKAYIAPGVKRGVREMVVV